MITAYFYFITTPLLYNYFAITTSLLTIYYNYYVSLRNFIVALLRITT
jgi:hypothetical protein